MLSSKVAILLICCVVAPILVTADSGIDDDVALFNQGAARPGQVPFIVSIRYASIHRGSGVILSNTWILTTASVLRDRQRHQMTLYVGAHSLRDGRRLGVNGIVRHPQYDARSRNNDLAMLRTVIQFNERVRPINLPTANAEGSTVILATSGWGVAYVSCRINL